MLPIFTSPVERLFAEPLQERTPNWDITSSHSKSAHSSDQKKLDCRLVKGLYSPGEEMMIDQPYERINGLNEVLYGYKSVTTTFGLFKAISTVFAKAAEREYQCRALNCLRLTKEWLNCDLYAHERCEVKEHVEVLFSAAKNSSSPRVLNSVEEVKAIWERMSNTHLERRSSDARSSTVSETASCKGIEDLIERCEYDPQIVAYELRTFLAGIQSSVMINDLLAIASSCSRIGVKAKKSKDRSSERENRPKRAVRPKRKNSFSSAALVTDKLANVISYDLLCQPSRADSEKRFEFYLRVSRSALDHGDMASAMVIYIALERHAIERLGLLGVARAPKRQSFWSFSKNQKKQQRLLQEEKSALYLDLKAKCNFCKQFSGVRKMEKESPETPRVLAVKSHDVAVAGELYILNRDRSNNPTSYNHGRIASFASIVEDFHRSSKLIKETSCKPKFKIGEFLRKSSISEDDLIELSRKIKPGVKTVGSDTLPALENWGMDCVVGQRSMSAPSVQREVPRSFRRLIDTLETVDSLSLENS